MGVAQIQHQQGRLDFKGVGEGHFCSSPSVSMVSSSVPYYIIQGGYKKRKEEHAPYHVCDIRVKGWSKGEIISVGRQVEGSALPFLQASTQNYTV